MIVLKENAILPILDCLEAPEDEFSNLFQKASAITTEYFGKKRSLFNPIYVSDICLSDCPYCGYRISNKEFQRKTLKQNETIQEATFLKERGIKNILVLAGDYKHSKYVEMLVTNIETIKQKIQPDWLGVEVATLDIDEYVKLKDAGAESVTVFQETYNRNRYNQLHKSPQYKGDFDFRYNAQERAIKAGINEVGFGVLYGVGFWIDDTIAMAEHALDLKSKYPFVKLRFSFPRLRLSLGQSDSCKTEEINEYQLLRAIVGIRLSFPDASLVLTGRETADFLTNNASIVDVLGFDGATGVGGYSIIKNGLNQFELDSEDNFNSFYQKFSKKGYGTFFK